MPQHWLRVAFATIVGVALAIGATARVTGIDRKIYWHDEVATLLELSGRTEADVVARLGAAPQAASDVISEFQDPSRATAGDVLRSWRGDEPQGSPLYLLLAHGVTTQAGVAGARGVSIVASLALVMVAGWLARELFDNRRIGWVAASLVAVSPPHVRYALEARSYALWALAVSLSSLLLLRAARRGRARDAVAYGVAAALAIHAHLLGVFVVAAHAVWLLLTRRERRNDATSPWWGVVLALALSVPWAILLAPHVATVSAHVMWTNAPAAIPSMASRWVGILTTVFIGPLADAVPIELAAQHLLMNSARAIAAACVLALLAWTMRSLFSGPRRAAWFVGALALLPALALIVPDIVLGGQRSMVPRYWVPIWLAVQLGVSSVVGSAITATRVVVFSLIVACGAGSVWASSRATTWWDTNPPSLQGAIAASHVVNQAPHAAVVTGAQPYASLVFARLLRADVRIDGSVSSVSSASSGPGSAAGSVFLYEPTPRHLAGASASTPFVVCADAPGARLWCMRAARP